MGLFFKQLCKFETLFSAWQHVRSRARKSKSREIRAAAEDFEQTSPQRLRSIQSRLVKGRYSFPAAEGILKDKNKREKQGKKPRPIVLADIESRTVQRALLQCLQPPPTSKLYPHLKILREINNSKVNYGGTPKGGVPKALKDVLNALTSNHIVYFKSDIAAFFTKVPHAKIVNFLLAETDDPEFVDVFTKAMTVQLKNAGDLKAYLNLFPDNEYGVPQGSALSALAGNIFLHDVDLVMSGTENIRFIRYIDDVIILGLSNEALQKAKSVLRKELRKRSLSLYDPATDPDKAAEGHTRNGFEYLGCLIQKNQIEPGKTTKENLSKKIAIEIGVAKLNIKKMLESEKLARSRETTFVRALSDIDELVRGWANSFRFANNRHPFGQVDSDLRRQIAAFSDWFAAQKPSSELQRMRALGIFQTVDAEYRNIEEY